jgi:hypothetical protein
MPSLGSSLGHWIGASQSYEGGNILLDQIVRLAYLFVSFSFGETLSMVSLLLSVVLIPVLIYALWRAAGTRPMQRRVFLGWAIGMKAVSVGVLKQRFRSVPGFVPLYRKLQSIRQDYRLRHMKAGEVFTNIFRQNRWGGFASVSGTGSDLVQTRVLIRELPLLFSDLEVNVVLDIPCGDFHWMKKVDLSGVTYIGADVVGELIERNQELYGRADRRFVCLNLITDRLPCADLVFCRDCLVHLSFRDIQAALKNIRATGARYLLTTTFPGRGTKNQDIISGKWRPLNLEAAPFFLPAPLRLINEECTENGGAFSDKSLGLWRLDNINR